MHELQQGSNCGTTFIYPMAAAMPYKESENNLTSLLHVFQIRQRSTYDIWITTPVEVRCSYSPFGVYVLLIKLMKVPGLNIALFLLLDGDTILTLARNCKNLQQCIIKLQKKHFTKMQKHVGLAFTKKTQPNKMGLA